MWKLWRKTERNRMENRKKRWLGIEKGKETWGKPCQIRTLILIWQDTGCETKRIAKAFLRLYWCGRNLESRHHKNGFDDSKYFLKTKANCECRSSNDCWSILTRLAKSSTRETWNDDHSPLPMDWENKLVFIMAGNHPVTIRSSGCWTSFMNRKEPMRK